MHPINITNSSSSSSSSHSISVVLQDKHKLHKPQLLTQEAQFEHHLSPFAENSSNTSFERQEEPIYSSTHPVSPTNQFNHNAFAIASQTGMSRIPVEDNSKNSELASARDKIAKLESQLAEYQLELDRVKSKAEAKILRLEKEKTEEKMRYMEFVLQPSKRVVETLDKMEQLKQENEREVTIWRERLQVASKTPTLL